MSYLPDSYKVNAKVGRFSLAEFHIHKMKEG